MLSRSAFYGWWALRWVIAFGLIGLADRVHQKYLPTVPWLVVQVPLVVGIVLGILRGPWSYAAYTRAAEKRNAAKTT